MNALGCNVGATAELSPDILARKAIGFGHPPFGRRSERTRRLFNKMSAIPADESAHLSSVRELHSPELEGTDYREGIATLP